MIIKIIPDFKKYWEKEDNYSVNQNGTFTFHGLFSEFTSFFRENYENNINVLEKLFVFIEECSNIDIHSESGLSNAVFTCFLENIADEGEISSTVGKYLGNNTKRFFEKLNE